MKAAAITGVRSGGVVEVPDPVIRGDFVKVRVVVAPMCTEYKGYRDGSVTTSLGHEAAGEVVETAQPGRFAVGDRVVVMPVEPCGVCPLCLGGEYIHCEHPIDARAFCGSETGTATYAQYLIKRTRQLIPIPSGMSYEHASMACCGLGPTFGAMERAGVGAFDTVLISGMGPVGLGGVINAKYRGARVIALEPHPYRRKLAASLGADELLDPSDPGCPGAIRDLTGGVGADVSVDCTGLAAAQRILIDSTRRRGAVCFVGEGGALEIAVSRDMIRKGLALYGSWHWNLADSGRMMAMIGAVGDLLDRQITHTFPMSRVTDAWELQLSGECGKILLDPWA
jgi:L-iditol 2-dehydrogenase